MATAKFYLNHPYLPGTQTLKKSEVPIDLKFSIDRTKRFTIATGERIKPKYWDKKEKAVKSTYVGHIDINRHLSEMKERALQVWRSNKLKPTGELRELIKTALKGEPTAQKKTVIEAVKLFIAQYEREKEKTTVGRYRVLLNKLTAFNPDLTFEQLDHNFYDAFKTFLYDSPNPVYSHCHLEYDLDSGVWIVRANEPERSPDFYDHPVPLMDDVVFKYIVQIKTICGWAEQRGYAVHPAFRLFEIIKREYRPISVTLEELERIESLPLPKHLDIARDYFSIECRTGQRISDIKRFSKLQLQDDNWVFTPKKGNRTSAKTVNLPLVGYSYPALLIFKKYNYQLPKLSEQNLNYSIKEVCKRAGINEEIFIERWAGSKHIRIHGKKYEFLSTHTGKKTFITVLANEGVPLLTISQLTQTSVRTIEKHYLGMIDVKNVADQLRKVDEKYSPLRKVN
jgi:hypothetical protein